MERNRLRQIAAVALVLAVGASVVGGLSALNATDTASAVGATGAFAFGGATVGVGALAVGAVLLAAGAVLLRRTVRTRRAPPTPRRR